MKKTGILIGLVICGLFCSFRASAQSAEIQQLLLNVEKLTQFKQILSDMKKGYQILEGGYNTIKDISEGNFSLHKAFLDGLRAGESILLSSNAGSWCYIHLVCCKEL